MNIHHTLSGFQAALSDALFAPHTNAGNGTALAALTNQPGFSVYRNTVNKGCIDALRANYPTVAKLVGEEWFCAAAALYLQEHKPQDARLLFYGEHFPHFLENFPPADDLPYLSGVAQLDRYWIESHTSADDATLDPACLSSLETDALALAVLRPCASCRWKWFDDSPVYTIWQRNREADDIGSDPVWQGEGALLIRQAAAVRWTAISAAHCSFLDACAAGEPLASAAAAAQAKQGDVDLAKLIATLLDAGAFCTTAPYVPTTKKETP